MVSNASYLENERQRPSFLGFWLKVDLNLTAWQLFFLNLYVGTFWALTSLNKGDYLSSCSDVSSTNKPRTINNIVPPLYLAFVTGVPARANSFSAARALKNKEKNDEEGGILWKCFSVRMAMLAIQATLHHLPPAHTFTSKTAWKISIFS